MPETTISPGYSIPKPVETQAECDAYSKMAEAVNAHNNACAIGDMTWTIEDKPDCYTVAESGIATEPEPAPPSLEEQVAALKKENASLTDQLTDLQVALCSLYEQAEGSETE